MRKYGRGVMAALALMMLMASPVSVNAQANQAGEENARFNFQKGKSHYHPLVWKAAERLREARRALRAAKGDFQGHRLKALVAIDTALDELRLAADAAGR